MSLSILQLPRSVSLPSPAWDALTAAHHVRVAPVTNATLQRHAGGQRHLVWDFLFSYYSFPPGRLLTWVPGVFDEQGSIRPESTSSGGAVEHRTWEVPPVRPRLRELALWVANLCQAILDRPPRYHCYGLHEWAMVYHLQPSEVRHASCRLRLSPAEIARFVDSQSLTCTHYDAFRFFTPPARPRNAFQPDLASRVDLEQRGCLHANMDLYKWSAKLWPWIGSTLVGEAFELAVLGRMLDMRASPYDLEDSTLPPVHVETAAGREAYAEEQRRITERADPIRRRLLATARTLAAANIGNPPPI